jgi:hypothetical protein
LSRLVSRLDQLAYEGLRPFTTLGDVVTQAMAKDALESGPELSFASSEPPLSSVPEVVFSPASTSLVHINLSRNHIEELPVALDQFVPSLTSLDISRNWVRVLPVGLPTSLRVLIASSNKLRPPDRSLPAHVLGPLHALELLDLRFNSKLSGSAAQETLRGRVPPGCEVLVTERQAREPMPSAGSRDASQLRCQLEPLSTPQLSLRLRGDFGGSFDPEKASREELLDELVAGYEHRWPEGRRPHTRVAGQPLGPLGRAALVQLLEVLRATAFPTGAQRERPKIRAEGYIILQRPATTALGAPQVLASAGTKRDADGESTRVAQDPAETTTAMATPTESAMTTKARLAQAKLRRHARIWELAEQIMREGDPSYADAYTAIAVTKQFQGSPHIDTENVAPFYGLGLGEYTGGFVCVESEDGMGVYEVDTQGRLGKVDGRRPHWVSPHEGERYSIIYYQTSGDVVPIGASVFAPAQPAHEQRT